MWVITKKGQEVISLMLNFKKVPPNCGRMKDPLFEVEGDSDTPNITAFERRLLTHYGLAFESDWQVDLDIDHILIDKGLENGMRFRRLRQR